MTARTTTGRNAFSLFELLVVLAILGFLLALLLPVVQRLRQAAGRAETMNNFKQVALATINYADTHGGKLPPAFDKAHGMPRAQSVHVYILPFLEQNPLYQNYLQGKGDDAAVVPSYVAPMDPSKPAPAGGVQNCAANLRLFSDKGRRTAHDAPMPALAAVEPGNSRFPASIPDGTSNTIFFATRYGVCGKGGSRFASPPNADTAALFGQTPARVRARPADVTATFLLHPSREQCAPTPLLAHAFERAGVIVAMCDGSSRLVNAAVSPQTWNLAVHPNDGTPLNLDE